ncbi:MAG: hypothetical protein JXB39_10565 [Deltaproteobacteria bacterium]|nr:hypothetical protein [Deltaproteobacteria bacterium]
MGPGYGLVTATAFDATAERKAMPVPLRFSLWSSAADDFDSTNALWLETIDLVCDHTHPEATVVIDREGDNRRVIDRLLLRHRPFVIRLQAGNSSRCILFGRDSRARVRDARPRLTRSTPPPPDPHPLARDPSPLLDPPPSAYPTPGPRWAPTPSPRPRSRATPRPGSPTAPPRSLHQAPPEWGNSRLPRLTPFQSSL